MAEKRPESHAAAERRHDAETKAEAAAEVVRAATASATPIVVGSWVKIRGGKTGRVMAVLDDGSFRVACSAGDAVEHVAVKTSDASHV